MKELTLTFHRPEPKPDTVKVDGLTMITLVCLTCQKPFQKRLGHYNYTRKQGIDRFFCSKACHHESRRHHKAEEQKKAEKAEYDRQYRAANEEKRKVQCHDWFKRTYDPVKAAIERKKRMPRHVAYCRRAEYRKWKAEYDKKYHAKKNYGEFWESHLLTLEIEQEYDQREVRQENNIHNKSQKRKRSWQQNQKNSLQVL